MDSPAQRLLNDLQEPTDEAVFLQQRLPGREVRRILRSIRQAPTSPETRLGVLKLIGVMGTEPDAIKGTLTNLLTLLVRKQKMEVGDAATAVDKVVQGIVREFTAFRSLPTGRERSREEIAFDQEPEEPESGSWYDDWR